MARGIANNEPVVSQANTEAFEEGYRRTFGDKKPQRGKWIATPSGLVPADEYEAPARSGTGIMVDRFMEGDRAPDGTDIGSRRKRKDWMRAADVVDHADFKGARERRRKAEAERHQILETGKPARPDPQLREFIGRELYKRKLIT